MSRRDDLIQKYLDGLLGDAESAELDRLLRESPEAADAFARASRRDQALASMFSEERDVSELQDRIRPPRPWRRRIGVAASLAAACLLILATVNFIRGSKDVMTLALPEGETRSLRPGEVVRGKAVLRFSKESTRLETKEGSEFVVREAGASKRIEFRRGTLAASVAPQAEPMVITTPDAEARVLGTTFALSTGATTRLEVAQGRVRLSRISDGRSVDVAAGRFATTDLLLPLPIRTPDDERFLALWRDLHDPAKGYFSAEGVPYHAAETLAIDGPDCGHLTTSETMSYWIWLEATYGGLTGDWSWLAKAWARMEEVLIPSPALQPTNRFYVARKPATVVGEAARPEDYPVTPDPSAPCGEDELATELRATYGTPDLYGMHWLADPDDWYGFGRRALLNTFERGPRESVWRTIPHPSTETFSWGGPNGFLDLFIREKSYARQWRYACAPDADARAIQAITCAATWARDQGLDPAKILPLKKAARMGDSLRYALREKYFGGVHGLMAWSYAWGGSLEENQGWAWRTGGSQIHIGYQNPFAAWALATLPDLRPASPNGASDWKASLERQLDFYRWLQSEEGAFAGGATASRGLSYSEHPVFSDPPSNEWFGWQPWAAERLAAYVQATGDPRAKPILEKWVRWARGVVELRADGSYAIPAKLAWRGAPGSLHVATQGASQDVGVASALARALLRAGETRLARELLDRIWARFRDDRGVSCPETVDPAQFFEKVPLPEGWTGVMPGGVSIRRGVTFLDLRPKHRLSPEFSSVERGLRTQSSAELRIHRFWAQVEVALACAELSRASR